MTVQTTSAAQPVSGVWDMFSQLAGLYVQDRASERAQVAAFNQYAYASLAASDKNNLTGFGLGGNTSSTNAALAAQGGGFVLTVNHVVIGVVLAAAVYFAVK